MTYKFVLSAAIVMGFVSPCFAANSTMTDTPSNRASTQPGQAAAASQQIAQKLKESLAQGGFTDIQIMPKSFLVRAKDKAGNKVMMVVNPDSVTSVTAMGSAVPGSSGSKMNSGPTGASTQNSQSTSGSTYQ